MEKDNMKQSDINITTEMIKEQVKKVLNWKSPEPDGVQGYWLKKLTTLHEHIVKQWIISLATERASKMDDIR